MIHSKRFALIASFALALAAASCQTSSAVKEPWTIAISTTGGFTGRGLGSASAQSADAPPALRSAVSAARPDAWQAEYTEPGNPHGYADQVRYTLTLTSGDRSWTSSWFDGSRRLLPRDLAAVFDAAWARR